MAERILKSPGVTTRELDLSAPSLVRPQGVPAGVIGTSDKGPAFVPTLFATSADFTGLFGDTKGVHYGVMGMKEWMRNARAGLFLRTLGVGDAKAAASTGLTTGAGFVVGEEIIDYTDQGGLGYESDAGGVWSAGDNPFAGDTAESQLEVSTIEAGKVAVGGLGEITSFVAVGGSADSVTPEDYDGLYITATQTDGVADTPTLEKIAFWVSSQAIVANGGNRDVNNNVEIIDGQFTIVNFAEVDATVNRVVLVDVSQATIVSDVAFALNTAITAEGFTIGATTPTSFTFEALSGTVDASAVASTGTSDPALLTVGQNQAGMTEVTPVNSDFTIDLSNDTAELHDGSTITVTESDGTLTVFEIDTDGAVSGGNTSIDVAGLNQAAAAGQITIAIGALATVTVSDDGTTVSIQLASGAQLPSISLSENAPAAPAGTTYFLSAPMVGSASNDYMDTTPGDTVRGVLMFANGVVPGLETAAAGPINSIPSAAWGEYGAGKDAGSDVGKLDNGMFRMVLNGFQNSDYNAHLTGSFDPTSPVYFAKVLNTDPSKLQERGHYLYASYDIPSGMAELHAGSDGTDSVKLYRGAHSYDGISKDTVDGTNPNFDNWRQKFTTAATPWIMSQKLGDAPKKLFRLHALDSGKSGAGKFKISILNIAKSTDTRSAYGRFDLQIRDAHDHDDKPVVLQTFSNLSLNPGSDRYIARVIGDQNAFFDFEKDDGKQKIVVEGLYPNKSSFVRVEVNEDIENGVMEATALPIGFRGKSKLNLANNLKDSSGVTQTLVEPALPLRSNLSLGQGSKKTVDSRLFWGVQTQDVRSVNERNKETGIISLVDNLTKHFPSMGTKVWSGDDATSDEYNNNGFSLEKVWIKVQGTDLANPVDPTMWAEAEYIRDANADGLVRTGGQAHTDANGSNKDSAAGYRYLDVAKDFGQSASKKYFKFSVPFEGGFDGLDIFDQEKAKMSNISSLREIHPTGIGATGPTTAAFRKAIDILAEKSDVDIQILATPGMRSPGVTDYAIDKTEDRFDALYIMDVDSLDHDEKYVTKSEQEVSVTNTAQALVNRNLDTSFAAAYFPDLVLQDGLQAVVVPPSVSVLGALSLNDAIAHPWFAPAGFARGALPTTIETAVKLNRTNMDVLYEADINPITSFPQTGESVIVFGQKTMLQSQSALDRVNVRRLLIDIRRKVRAVANGILFEPNRESTLSKFSAMVNPILGRIQSQNGLTKYKVVIDTSTTTQQDVENNTIRGKIFLQPTKSVEFISLDFVVGNQGMEL